jgi:hypothetical protein
MMCGPWLAVSEAAPADSDGIEAVAVVVAAAAPRPATLRVGLPPHPSHPSAVVTHCDSDRGRRAVPHRRHGVERRIYAGSSRLGSESKRCERSSVCAPSRVRPAIHPAWRDRGIGGHFRGGRSRSRAPCQSR